MLYYRVRVAHPTRVDGTLIAFLWAHNSMSGLDTVKHIVAVASGKGGVGKSTTAVNLAAALAHEGFATGLLDADIYGPSQPVMLGMAEGTRPAVRDEKFFVPVEAHGLKTMSMGYLVTEKTPMVWRGPMASGALQQLLSQTLWGELDILVIDMPPGTGDIQLTLSQQVPVSGALIVTTPQDIALLDAKKGIEMFRKVNIPVLGIIENMALHVCSECGHEEHLFGAGGGERIAADYNTELICSLPLQRDIREQTDSGHPAVTVDPESAASKLYRAAGRQVMQLLQAQQSKATAAPNITISDD